MALHLSGNIDPDLWSAIATSYEAGSYANSVTDAIHYLSDEIRDKIESDVDGVQLVGLAFGGESPQIRLNKFQSETDKGEQKGFESILRGIYQGIRNPRSHQQYKDSKESADAIIIFVNYLIKLIHDVPERFELSSWIDQVLDQQFVASQEYASLLCDEVPNRYLIEAMTELLARRSQGDIKNIAMVIVHLVDRLTNAKKREYATAVSIEFRKVNDEFETRRIIQLTPQSIWPLLERVPKLRIENMLIESLKRGKATFDRVSKQFRCTDGHLATWGWQHWSAFSMRKELQDAVLLCLQSSTASRQYLKEYFLPVAIDLFYASEEFRIKRNDFVRNIKQSIQEREYIFDSLIRNKSGVTPLFRSHLMGQLEDLRGGKLDTFYWTSVYPFTDEYQEELEMLHKVSLELSAEFGSLNAVCSFEICAEPSEASVGDDLDRLQYYLDWLITGIEHEESPETNFDFS